MDYKLDLPSSSRVHPVFHVSWLKKLIGNKIPIKTIFPIFSELDEEGQVILKPEQIMETRTKQLHNRAITEYLIKWKNLSIENSTWEDETFVQKHPQLIKH